MPASSTPHMKGRDTARERGLPGHGGAVISKDRQELAATSRIFCLWDPPESIQGVSTGPCSLLEHLESSHRAAVLPLGLSAPRVVQHPLLQALHPPLAPSPFPKGIPAWGCPHHKWGQGHWGTHCSQSSAVEHCWSWVCQWDAQHQRAQGSAKGSPPDLETLFKHCHSMSWLPRAGACTWISAQAQHSLSGCLWAPTPDRIFISLSQNIPWPGKLSAPPVHSPRQVQVEMGRTISDPPLLTPPSARVLH